MCINGGYFVLRQGIFDYLEEGDDLVMDGCVRGRARRKVPCGALPGVLGSHGHAQGADRAREPVQAWDQPVGAVARSSRRPG